jgi:hypothetical protein
VQICATKPGVKSETILGKLLGILEADGSSFQDEIKLIACSSICNLTTDNVEAQKEMIQLQANSKLIGVMNADNLRLTKMAIACLWLGTYFYTAQMGWRNCKLALDDGEPKTKGGGEVEMIPAHHCVMTSTFLTSYFTGTCPKKLDWSTTPTLWNARFLKC